MGAARRRSLTEQLKDEVGSRIRRRGEDYYRRGAVKEIDGDGVNVEAVVRGTRPYRVQARLVLPDKVLVCSCTCPYFAGSADFCKHIWATLLAAERSHLLNVPDGIDKLMIDLDDGMVESVDEHGDEEDYDDLSWVGGAGAPGEAGGRAEGGSRGGRVDRGGRRGLERSWKAELSSIAGTMDRWARIDRPALPIGSEILYLIDIPATLEREGLQVEIAYRRRRSDGGWAKPKSKRLNREQIETLPDPTDRQILGLLAGSPDPHDYRYRYSYSGSFSPSLARHQVPAPIQAMLVRLMCESGRCFCRKAGEKEGLVPLRWDEGPPWEFRLEIRRAEEEKSYTVGGSLRRGEERVSMGEASLLTAGGLVLIGERAARLEFGGGGAFAWIVLLRGERVLTVPAREAEEMLARMLALPRLPLLDLAEELRFAEAAGVPRPRLRIRAPRGRRPWTQLSADLSFDYEGVVVDANCTRRGIYRPGERRFLLRDREAEEEAEKNLFRLGLSEPPIYRREGRWHFDLAQRRLPRVVEELVKDGWRVEAEGKVFRRAGSFDIDVRSGIDWFELHGRAEFEGQVAELPELLQALRRGESAVPLGDGTVGILPEEWLKRYRMISSLGEVEEDHVRFRPTQVGLLDALLAAMPEVRCDALFQKARAKLQEFAGIRPKDAPAGFRGELRGYQRDGLGWLHFLRSFGFGGCLADDMGLGKTVQVLALLESRRRMRRGKSGGRTKRPPPSLVVVPRSIVYNWCQEAARFAPNLRVLDHTGPGRFHRDGVRVGEPPTGHFEEYDLIVTTYGTLRRDAARLREFRFDYAILDEAQAIKNAKTASAKAARLLQADHRLAMSGTPIENHLGELWSLFEFLNPGMLGSGKAALFLQGAGGGPLVAGDPAHALLSRALRPYILRRTKEQVAADLPKKLEQTLFCDLAPKQRRLYDELRDHYRGRLLKRIDDQGINRSKIQVLEALLRLRQAACHPRLIDGADGKCPSAKLDMLLPQLAEVIDEGHKALVFSQFTKLLGIVREELDKEGVCYEYLDGRTRKRRPKIERFQTDPECRLFLISLKAGGLGLNLTAADYVFLLDPWWNPAVEAQAIDRTHRIGQTRNVFAYRLIARDTVEEKVLELQKAKRGLADAILTADNSLIRNLTREEIELLLA